MASGVGGSPLESVESVNSLPSTAIYDSPSAIVRAAAVVALMAPPTNHPTPGKSFQETGDHGATDEGGPARPGHRGDERAQECLGELDPEGGGNLGQHADLNGNQHRGVGERDGDGTGRARRHGCRRYHLVRGLLLEFDIRLLGGRQRSLDCIGNQLHGRIQKVPQAHRWKHHVGVVEALTQRPNADHVFRFRQQALHIGPESLVGTGFGDDAKYRHEVRQPPVQLDLGLFDPPAILGQAHPRGVDVLVHVGLRGLRAYEVRQLVDDLPVLLQLQSPGVVYRQRDSLLRNSAGLFRDRLPLPRRGPGAPGRPR